MVFADRFLPNLLARAKELLSYYARTVRRALASSLLSLLLLATSAFGGCLSCEQYFMWPGVKSCCAPDGHCKTKTTPTNRASVRECKRIAFDHQKSADHHVDLRVVAAVAVDIPMSAIELLGRWHETNAIKPSPPDLQVLHSIFLI